jgi:hypothetical protein
MTPDSSKVWARIAAAFPAVLPLQPITACDCEECQDVRASLGHLSWSGILAPAIDKHFGSLPLLTDEAFHALLPAFLFHALADINHRNKVLEWTLYSLCGRYEEDEAATGDAGIRARIGRFTVPQRDAIRAFLRLVPAAPDLAFHHDPIARALSAFWG